MGLGLLEADPFGQSRLFERLAEIALLISLFVAGLKLSVPLRNAQWLAAITHAVVATSIVVLGISVTPLMRYYIRREGPGSA